MISDVSIKITQKAAAKKIGFGIPLLLSTLEKAEIPYSECSGLDQVKAKFPEETAVYKAAQLLFMQENAPASVAVCGSIKKATDALEVIWREGFRQIIITSLGKVVEGSPTASEDSLNTIAQYVEAKGEKVLFATIHTQEGLSSLTANGLTRLVAFFHTADSEGAAALVGATAGLSPGSFTYKNIILKGISPLELSAADLNKLHAKGAFTLVTKAGDNVTSEGITVSGDYIDILDSKDYVIQQMEYSLQKTLNTQPAVPYDNNGIALLESVTVNVLQGAFRTGIIARKEDGTADYSVSFATREEVDPADRAARRYLGGSFRFGLSRAVHTVEITGEIEI